MLDAALAGIAADCPIVDHLTVLPQRVAHGFASSRIGARALHAPVFMGPPMALESKGVMMASGELSLFASPCVAIGGDVQRLTLLRRSADLAAIYKLLGNAMILAVVGGLNDALAHRRRSKAHLARAAYELFDFFDPAGKFADVESAWPRATTIRSGASNAAHKDALLMQAAAHHEQPPGYRRGGSAAAQRLGSRVGRPRPARSRLR